MSSIIMMNTVKKSYRQKFTVLEGGYGKESYTVGREERSEGISTEMECLYTTEEILAVYNIFRNKVEKATSISKERDAMRNITMFVCAIHIGLRGGDFCRLKWKQVYDEDWNIKKLETFAPEKQTRRNKTGKIISRKYVKLRFDSDFRKSISQWLEWNLEHGYQPSLDDFIFPSQKGGNIEEKSWYKIIEKTRIEAKINQRIGTHGLRKTYGHSYYLAAPNKQDALIHLMNIFGHSDMRITLIYICITDEEIFKNQERMCIFSKDDGVDDFLCPQDEIIDEI